MTKRILKSIAAIFCFMLLTACTTVKPWEKGYLARQEMGFVVDPLEQKLSNHIYFSKEAANSQSANSGGGCGCN
jgi:hypothetical protein